MAPTENAKDKQPRAIGYSSLFGGLIGALSLFSLAEQYLSFGLSSVLSDVLSYYRSVLYSFFQRILFWTDWKPTQLMSDLWGLSFMGGMISFRTTLRTNDFQPTGILQKVLYYFFGIFVAVIIGLTFIGMLIILAPLISLGGLFSSDESDAKRDTLIAGQEILLAGLFLLIFFGLNAYAPAG